MSLENTKPRWAPQSIATERGWVDPKTGEVYVAIGNLKSRLEAASKAKSGYVVVNDVVEVVEETSIVEVVDTEPVKEEVVEVKEIVVDEIEKVIEKEVKRRGRPAKTQVNEVVEQPLAEGQRVIGEVVENPLDKQILGE